MEKKDIEKFLGLEIKIILRSGYFYSGGIIRFLDEDSFSFLDKFGIEYIFSLKDISSIIPNDMILKNGGKKGI